MAERGSERVHSLLIDGIVATSRLSEVEVASALARHCREGTFSAAERDRALGALRRDISSFFVVELSPEVVTRGVALLTRTSLRAADAVQLASCIELRNRLQVDCVFVCADSVLSAAARQEGLLTVP